MFDEANVFLDFYVASHHQKDIEYLCLGQPFGHKST